MAEDGKAKIEKFDGKYFRLWKMKLEDYLYQKELHLPLLGKIPEKLSDAHRGAYGPTGLGDNQTLIKKERGLQYCQRETTIGVLKALSNMYEKTSASNKVFLIHQLVNTKMKEAISMKTCRLIRALVIRLTMVVLLSHARACEFSANRSLGNDTRWEVLEAVSNGIHFDDEVMVRQKEYYGYYLWNMYKTSSRSQRPKVVNEISETFKEISYHDSRHDMIGLILFGPVEGPSILRARDHYETLDVADDYNQCLTAIAELFMKHCGPLTDNGMKHTHSFSNICLYVKEKATIEDAIILTCGWNNVAPSGVDVGNPSILVTPTPVHGSSGNCGRVYVNGVSRMKFQNFAKAYQVMLEPSVFRDVPHNKVQICFHRNLSLGLCECEKDDWRSVENVLWGRPMSPYEQWFVDVKFDSGVSGHITVTLKEVPYHRFRCGLLAMGVGLLFVAGTFLIKSLVMMIG